MRVFVTGANGHIGTAVVTELVGAGHEVLGLSRSEAGADQLAHLGAEVIRGDVNDPALMAATAAGVDGVVHLAYDNAAAVAGRLQEAVDADLAVIAAFGNALAGTGKTFIGIGFGRTGDPERDRMLEANPRVHAARAALDLTERGIRAMLIGIPPVTHSDRDRGGFIPTLIRIARRTGVSGYVGEGNQHWPTTHTLDLATLYRLALEQAPAGSQLVGASEPGVPVRDIAAVIGQQLDLPVRSIPADAAADHFAPFPFMELDLTMPNDQTPTLLGWEPSHPGLLEDLAAGHYFDRIR